MTQNPEQNSEVSQLKRALLALKEMRARLETYEQARSEPIAVIGIGCRFPGGANSPAAFWKLLIDGVDAITEVPPDRWSAEEIYSPDFMMPGKANTRWGGFLDQVDEFDPAFFGISPREAMRMDPQQRLLLQVAYEAIEDAGLLLEDLEGSLTGVFAGVHSHSNDYTWMQMRSLTDIDTHTAAGTGHSIIANRLSYLFDWQGPSITVDTACSSSLVTAHLAVQSLRNRECNLALIAGLNLMLTPESTITYSKLQMMASDGRCKTFDSRADGFVRGEGCGVVVVKRLSDAVADGDRILALIMGSAVNQDGRTNGLTAPNGLSQQKVIRAALSNGRVLPEQINYVETHGTGTRLGDPIEVEALAEVIGQRKPDSQPCILGSVKTNIGHLEGAAGIAGLIKAVLVLHQEAIPPQLHFKHLNPLIRLADTRFEIPTALRPYPRADQTPRFAGVSSFSFGGTNAHLVLKEASVARDVERPVPPAPYLLTLSARGDEALVDLVGAYQAFLASTESSLVDIVYTASTRRSQHDKRLAVVGSTSAELVEKLAAFQRQADHPDVVRGQTLSSVERGLAFVFSGQGPQWLGMGRELMQTSPVFKDKLLEIDALLRQVVPWSLVAELNADDAHSRLAETEVAQPAIFAMQVALAAVWKSWGIEPEAVVGHSVGEIAAAHVAGVLSLEDAVRVVYHRSRLMQRVTGQGKMAAVGLTREQAETLIAGYAGLSIGAVNSPVSTVLSGNAAALEEIVASLSAKGTFARMLPVNYAFHSPVMDDLMTELASALSGITSLPARVTLYSTVRGERAREGDYDAGYWAKNIRQPVLFADAIRAMRESGASTFIEVSPHPVLSETIHQCLGEDSRAVVVPSLRRGQPERGVMLRGLGLLYTCGYPIRWDALYPHGRLVDLPHYPWQNARYWLPGSGPYRAAQPGASSAALALDVDWFYDLAWHSLPQNPDGSGPVLPVDWLVYADQQGIGQALCHQLQNSGHTCRVVMNGETFDLAAWLQSTQSPRGIIDLRALNATSPIDDSACTAALHTVQALLRYTGQTQTKLWLVTQGVQSVQGEMPAEQAASQSLSWGLGRTIALEAPEIWGGLLDLESGDASMLADMIAVAVTASDGEDQVAVRGGARYGARLIRAERPAIASTKIAADGVYLITGGLGGLGQHLARWLVRHGAKYLVLTSRAGLPDRAVWAEVDPNSLVGQRIAAVQEIEAAGAQVSVVAADVADEPRMAALFETFGDSRPPLRGVLHAAGTISKETLAVMDDDALRSVLKSKVTGSWILHCLTQSMTLDFFALFSSSAGIFGSAGLGHYAAANHYLDTLASIRRGAGLPAVSIDWGWWGASGITTPEIEEQFRSIGQQAMPVEPALRALDALLHGNPVQKIVASVDWERFLPIYEARRARPLIEHMRSDEQSQPAPKEDSAAEQILAAPLAQRFDLLKAHVRDQVAQVLGFGESGKIDPQQGFFSLGMDSVMAVQLRIRFEKSMGQPLPSTIAFEYPTIDTFTAYLADEVLKLNAVSTAVPSAEGSSPAETPGAAQKALSEDELLSKLDEELAAFNRLAEGD